ncbi:uncharacterized protein DEA37_0011915 [Paragonimus westermani]|uniref:Uncharacterized protein n=1 Tax=Paragonimus westermani TaxID=34504 RepID=A0A5J4P035_9TREM|nr:uncharacterized protein DEA37_0011915 [Paragonimus westermani]
MLRSRLVYSSSPTTLKVRSICEKVSEHRLMQPLHSRFTESRKVSCERFLKVIQRSTKHMGGSSERNLVTAWKVCTTAVLALAAILANLSYTVNEHLNDGLNSNSRLQQFAGVNMFGIMLPAIGATFTILSNHIHRKYERKFIMSAITFSFGAAVALLIATITMMREELLDYNAWLLSATLVGVFNLAITAF